MAIRLTENLSSAYIGAAHKLYPQKSRRKIIAYVESYDDIPFWRALLADFENEEHYFQIMLPSANSLTKGKKMALMSALNTSGLGENLIACVDSDYDYLLQGATYLSKEINESKYVFQTYTYAIENYRCYAGSLHEVCVQTILNDRQLVDFNEFMRLYSRITYPLFIWSVYFQRKKDVSTFPITAFGFCAGLHEVDIRNIDNCLKSVEKRVNKKLAELEANYSKEKAKVELLGTELIPLGLNPDTTYLFIQGHHIMDNVVIKLLNPICTILRREREEEIKSLAKNEEQYANELACYQHTISNIETMLRKNIDYKDLFLYKQLQKDIENFFE